MAEGIDVDSNNVYIAFESAAKRFHDNSGYSKIAVDYFGKYNSSKFGI